MIGNISVPFFGGCACGTIRYECSAAPLRMINCHCRDCQRASGSGYSATAVMASASVRLVRGRCAEHRTVADSGNMARREFCSRCGTPLFASSLARPEFIGVKVSTLDDPSWFAPEADVWVASAQPWDFMDPSVSKFDKHRSRQSSA